VARVLMLAHEAYDDEKFQASLEKLGDFLILAQMPDPQPGWCQQYDYQMFPIWARKFEPPAIAGWESQDVLETLIRITNHTGKQQYLTPVPRALEYLNKSLLTNHQLARYYELKTNKPLYMDKSYQLTYDDSAVPSHYGWKVPARVDSIMEMYQAAKKRSNPDPSLEEENKTEDIRSAIQGLDNEGRWISTFSGERLVGQPKFAVGFSYISSEVFSRNVKLLSEFIASQRQ
jgi:hypothetical protein